MSDFVVLSSDEINATAHWSFNTFGPGERVDGIISHIEKEISEVELDPKDLFEWIDIIILAIDGATRQGYNGPTILNALKTKWGINKARTWPDWRDFSEDQPIEHVRTP